MEVGGFPFFYGFQLLPIHLDFPLSNDHAQKFHARGVKYAFREFDQQSMFSKSLKYMPSLFMVEGNVVFSVDAEVIHVDFQPFLSQHVSKDVIHECLKRGGSIAESEEHDSGFEESHGSNESGLPLILLPDVNVVISPMNVELGEQGGLLHVINEFQDEGEWVGISDSVGVQVVIILAWVKGSVLLWYEEEGEGLGGFQGYNLSCLKVFFDKRFTHFHLCWVERVDLGNFGGEVWTKFNGMVIRAMRGKLVMSFL